jgi:predicted dehydrogenase
MSNKNTDIAIVGCGAVVQDMYAPALKALGTEVVAVCDLDRDRAAQVGRELGAPVATLDDALARADIVVVAAPPATHFELAGRALAAGCDVLCEKPFVANTEQARELVSMASLHGRQLFVGHFRRLSAPVRAARQLISSGLLGDPCAVTAMEGARFSWRAKSAYTLEDKLGGVLYDTGSHLLDMVMFALGLDQAKIDLTVRGVQREPHVEPSHELRAEIELSTDEHRIPVKVGLSRYELLANIIRIRCTLGTIEIPTGGGAKLRVRGPNGDFTVESQDGAQILSDAFVAQLREIMLTRACDDLLADRFIGLTHVLESVLDYSDGHA